MSVRRADARARARARVRVHGTVQGVGFRPYVYRLAGELGLRRLGAQRRARRAARGRGRHRGGRRSSSRACEHDAPPLAVVERVGDGGARADRRPPGSRSARARAARSPTLRSRPTRRPATDCLRELLDPADRRYRYPFINCTNCGPRFTIVRGVPYDRPLTTMAGFAMCDALPGGVRGPGRPALPRPAERVPGVRAGGARCSTRTAQRSIAGGGLDAVGRSCRAGAARRRDRRGQGHRRLPPRLPRRRRAGGRARCGRASTARTSRSR